MTQDRIIYGDELYQAELNPLRDEEHPNGLTPDEVALAEWWLQTLRGPRRWNGLQGLMLVTGEHRSGKDQWATSFTWRMKRLFKGLRIVRDEPPRPAFGEWTLFNEQTFRQACSKMIAIGADVKAAGKPNYEQLANRWADGEGAVMLHKSIAHLGEFYRWQYNRSPHDMMNKALGAIHKTSGHTEVLVVGITQWTHDLDRFTCLPWVTHEVRCEMSEDIPDTTIGHLFYTKFHFGSGQLVRINKRPIRIPCCGSLERPEMGLKYIDDDNNIHYNRVWDLYDSKSAPIIKLKAEKLPKGVTAVPPQSSQPGGRINL